MSEFFQTYGFFIVIAALMLVCHLAHFGRGGHGGHGGAKRDAGERSREAKPDEQRREAGGGRSY